MTPQEFIDKWKRANLTERSAAQQHFLDLCDLLQQRKPADADPEGSHYTFERGVHKTDGGDGWADVWMRGHFGWEYKGKHKDLNAAYRQLLQYREALENPPLLVVCDLNRFEIHTNFTGTAKAVYAFDLDGLAKPENFDVLRRLFVDPDSLRPDKTRETITRDAADCIARVADSLRERGVEAHSAAHFLMKLMFCMFAEDIRLLPSSLFSKLLTNAGRDADRLTKLLRNLFSAMAHGGDFGADEILHFNGGLFADGDVVGPLTAQEIDELNVANCQHNWADVEPSIFGTLFERLLGPQKRSQIGAHYTSREDIETLVRPVIMEPLLGEWDQVQRQCEELWPRIQEESRSVSATRRKTSKSRSAFDQRITAFVHRLAHVQVLDPACGSGNFLYVALHLLLDLEKAVLAYARSKGTTILPQVRPTQLLGIEINPYAQELAQVVIWIGYLQWMHHNGFNPPRNPVLDPIESIRCADAIVDLTNPDSPSEPEWPAADFIVGNPPFLGGKRILAELGADYTAAMRRVWDSRLPRFSDLCCYWFEKARSQIERGMCVRAGLLATQSIRGGANREVLNRIKKSSDIFFAESDRDWILEGAIVHVSMVGFGTETSAAKILDGMVVGQIHANLTSVADVTISRTLARNMSRAFVGVQKSGPFDISMQTALDFLKAPSLAQRPTSNVIRIYYTAVDVVRRPLDTWVIDFGQMQESEAALFHAPFEHVRKTVPPSRSAPHFRGYPFWHLWRPREEMHVAVQHLPRFVVTPHVLHFPETS